MAVNRNYNPFHSIVRAYSVDRPGVPPRISEHRSPGRAWLLAGAAVAVLGGVVLFLFNPAETGFYPFCVFHRTTGLLCPGCGGLRALHQLLHGHLATAFRLNPLLVGALPWIGWASARWLLARRAKRRVPARVRPVWLWVGFALLVAFGVARNLPLAHDWPIQ